MPIRYVRYPAMLATLGFIVFLGGCAQKQTPEAIPRAFREDISVTTAYGDTAVRPVQTVMTDGVVVRNSDGSVILVQHQPGAIQTAQISPLSRRVYPPHLETDLEYADAREIKLKVRELTEQLIADMQDCSLQGAVALPTSFVHLDNFDDTSSFGRLLAEQLYYEFNQRGYPIREYRMPGTIDLNSKGEFSLTRNVKGPFTGSSSIVVGTYYNDREAIFVNARLLRPQDGLVLRTASLVFRANPVTDRMLANSTAYARQIAAANSAVSKERGRKLSRGSMMIRDFKRANNPPQTSVTNATPFDMGQDIH